MDALAKALLFAITVVGGSMVAIAVIYGLAMFLFYLISLVTGMPLPVGQWRFIAPGERMSMMSIIRIKKENRYSVISNAPLNDKALSWEARGVMAYLLTKPDGWECRNYDLVNQGPAGKHIIQRVLKELQEAGYIYRYRKSDGRKIEWITEIYETPELNTTSRNTDIPTSEEPTVGSSDVRGSGHIVSTDSNKYLLKENTDFNGSAKNSETPVTPIIETIRENEKQSLNTLADQIAAICKIDVDMASPKTREALKNITLALNTKKITQDDLKSFSIWWYDYSWQGKKGQAPTPGQLGDNWGQYEANQMKKSNNNGPTLTPEQKAQLEYFRAQDAQK